MSVGLQGCIFCDIVHTKKQQHLKESENAVVIADAAPHAPHHYLILSKRHISKPTDLTPGDIDLVKEMEHVGREYLREALKAKGEADTVEDLLRMGFHGSVLVSVKHLHMHLLYPVSQMSFIYRSVIFRPGHMFHLTKDVIEELEQQKGGATGAESTPPMHLETTADGRLRASSVTELGASPVTDMTGQPEE
ncbi:unnamed protein product [Anisakis simplex]|uniref:Adenosine 5'-monophosphoramidase HINT3 n=1 Tax=Anisakis simplex TaxID=6269 RepID=A0A0M3JZ38_ANISI|nr:unnamed protein product [Anisakis simplex]